MSIDIRVNDKALQEFLDRIEEQLEEITPVIGEAAQLELTKHLADKDRKASSHRTAARLGANPSGLYADLARALTYRATSTGVTLSINHPAAAQRYYGGIIKPVNAKYLTIPVAPESYGKALGAGDFTEQIVFLFGPGRKPYAAARASDPSYILYILAEQVDQPADPTVLPTDADFTTAILNTLSDALELE